MRVSPRSRVLATRLVVLSAVVGATALVGLGSATTADARPTVAPTTTSSTPAPTKSNAAATPATATTASTTSTAATSTTTTAANTTTATTTTATTTTATTTTATTTTATTAPVTPSSGPPCRTPVVLTPVVCVPTGSGEDQPAPIGTDGFVEFAAQVVNNGPYVSDATVVITLPAGLRLESDEDDPVNRYEDWWLTDSDDEGTALACTSTVDGSGVTCDTGSVPAGANFLVVIDLEAQDDAVAGTSGIFSVGLQSAPSPGTFPTTSVEATVDYVGTAHLEVHLTPVKATALVGKTLTLVATVHNLGPNTAVEAAGVGFISSVRIGLDQPFLITNSAPIPGLDSDSGAESGAGFALRPLRALTAGTVSATTRTAATRIAVTGAAGSQIEPTPPSVIGYWPIGTIAPGGTESVKVVVKAETVGQADLEFDAGSVDESCEDGTDPDCENTATAELSAVAPTTTTAVTTPPTTTASAQATTSVSTSATSTASTAALPNTGFHPAPWLTWGGAAIVLGLGLIMIGAPRRRGSGCHR